MLTFIRPIVLLIVLHCLAFTPTVRGDLIVTIEDLMLSPGADGTANVFVRSDNTTDTLADFSFTFHIDRVGATASQLRFANPQLDGQLNGLNYIFWTGSLKRDGGSILGIPIPASPVGIVSTAVSPDDTYTGSDSATPLPNSVVVGTTNRLLAQLELRSAPDLLATQLGDVFRISMETGNVTSYLNADGAPLTYTLSSASAGRIGIAAVPEPSGLAMLWLLGWLALGNRGVRRTIVLPLRQP